MALPDFQYERPSTVDEAIALLSRNEGAKVLAGGQTLIPLIGMGLAQPQLLVDIGRISDLRYIRETNGRLEIGALTTHVELIKSELVQRLCPVWAEAAQLVGHSHIRQRGTIGGVLAHADPAAEYPVVALLTEAEIVLQGPNGKRQVPAGEFFFAPFITAMAEDELLVSVIVPVARPEAGTAFLETVLRSGDFALAAAGAEVTVAADGTVAGVRLAVGGVTPASTRLAATEQVAVGRQPTPELWAEMGRQAATEITPEDDLYGSSWYRRELASVLVRDTLALAYSRVGERRG